MGSLLLPLAVAMAAADALAGESAHGTLRGLLLAPVLAATLGGLASSSLRAGCYLLIGISLTLARMATREA